ncbi:hypothetical protein OLEAN_C20760 [Oleispira antarctica RB-8]|uniref:Type II secretion system protein GspB C-terminal domain-containing protein n=1 Tax=Oleispira antarctica RB-8 TaxID=698738 RepID=R4YMX0_OLEAN|nr:hypothetical protein OLEAN_C20760 [Oleispira antarctica RB-8]
MSYILQALKKSEQERELAAHELHSMTIKDSDSTLPSGEQTSESHNDARDGRMIPLSVYGWAGGLLIVLVLISGYVQQIAFQQTDTQEVNAQKADKLPLEKIGIKSAVILESVLPQLEVPSVVIEEQVVAKPVANKKVVQQESAQLIKPSVPVEQATKEVQSLVPNINISSHIYSSMPTRRSIVVNGERLVETDFITPNVQVKEITSQGMIIDVDGSPLVVDRSRGWSR